MEKKLTKKQINNLAKEIFEYLVEHKLWEDVKIYFNGKSWGTYNPETKEYYYNQHKYYEMKNDDPSRYFEYVNPNHILSMSFEGSLYDVLNGYYYEWTDLEDQFMDIFSRYGVYYELGNAWNLSVYY